eukprot:CAMPEP_0194270142 /NCGR_PEP_ID=MMETSP0169-20130528/4187_1 /TAXON_ID=218684 /ORGANISM="Corethron pennatum, Strain L29A3" /LENGTH=635 /DNA_ID=CAMNT_0039012077 /DNA_START=270 /DNA_END=2177 /DNA_ORIENTATION=+
MHTLIDKVGSGLDVSDSKNSSDNSYISSNNVFSKTSTIFKGNQNNSNSFSSSTVGNIISSVVPVRKYATSSSNNINSSVSKVKRSDLTRIMSREDNVRLKVNKLLMDFELNGSYDNNEGAGSISKRRLSEEGECGADATKNVHGSWQTMLNSHWTNISNRATRVQSIVTRRSSIEKFTLAQDKEEMRGNEKVGKYCQHEESFSVKTSQENTQNKNSIQRASVVQKPKRKSFDKNKIGTCKSTNKKSYQNNVDYCDGRDVIENEELKDSIESSHEYPIPNCRNDLVRKNHAENSQRNHLLLSEDEEVEKREINTATGRGANIFALRLFKSNILKVDSFEIGDRVGNNALPTTLLTEKNTENFTNGTCSNGTRNSITSRLFHTISLKRTISIKNSVAGKAATRFLENTAREKRDEDNSGKISKKNVNIAGNVVVNEDERDRDDENYLAVNLEDNKDVELREKLSMLTMTNNKSVIHNKDLEETSVSPKTKTIDPNTISLPAEHKNKTSVTKQFTDAVCSSKHMFNIMSSEEAVKSSHQTTQLKLEEMSAQYESEDRDCYDLIQKSDETQKTKRITPEATSRDDCQSRTSVAARAFSSLISSSTRVTTRKILGGGSDEDSRAVGTGNSDSLDSLPSIV